MKKVRSLGAVCGLIGALVLIANCGRDLSVPTGSAPVVVGPGVISRLENGNEVLYEIYLRPEGAPEGAQYSFLEVVGMERSGLVQDNDVFDVILHAQSVGALQPRQIRGMLSAKEDTTPPPAHNPCCDPPSTWGKIKCCYGYEQP